MCIFVSILILADADDIADAEWRYVKSDQMKRIGFVMTKELLESSHGKHRIYHKHFSCHETVELPGLPKSHPTYVYKRIQDGPDGLTVQKVYGPHLTIFVK